MKSGKGSQGIAAICMLAAGMVVAYGSSPVYNGIQSAGQGTPVDVSGKDSQAYQVEGLWKKSDNSYVVHASAQGFQSEIQMEVTFDESGEQIQQVKVLAQGDTDGIGSKITEDGFAAGFAGVQAPVQIKDMEVASPVAKTPAPAPEAAAEEQEPQKPGRSNPDGWNTEDKSPEANAVRVLYGSEMLESALDGQPLATALVDLPATQQAARVLYSSEMLESALDGQPPATVLADLPVKERTARILYNSEMLESALDGRPFTAIAADLPPAQQAEARLEQAGLLERHMAAEKAEAPAQAAAVPATAIDGVSGATISSKGAATAVNNAYFFLKEEMGD